MISLDAIFVLGVVVWLDVFVGCVLLGSVLESGGIIVSS